METSSCAIYQNHFCLQLEMMTSGNSGHTHTKTIKHSYYSMYHAKCIPALCTQTQTRTHAVSLATSRRASFARQRTMHIGWPNICALHHFTSGLPRNRGMPPLRASFPQLETESPANPVSPVQETVCIFAESVIRPHKLER